MTMMISKFHKLIQSKVVWYIILGVIVLAFVGFFTPSMRSGSKRPDSKPLGELFGEKVMSREYDQARRHTYLWYVLSSGSMPPTTDEMVAMVRKEAWQRVAALRKAASEKIGVSDQEVVQQIQQLSIFQGNNGLFDAHVYQSILGYLGISSHELEGIFREQITLHKLIVRSEQAALISPNELRTAYHLYTDRFVLQTAVFPREQIEKEVTISREEADLFFVENRELFRMPARVRVSYVEWAVSNFMAQVEIPEGAALEFYNQNIENYRVENEDELALVEYKPFEEAVEEINQQLVEVAARRLAIEEATTLVADTSPKAEGEEPDFAGAVDSADLLVKTLPAFDGDDELSGIDGTAPFRQAAFRLEDNTYGSFSDAVVGKDSVYVLSLEKQYPSFLPDFEVVEDQVMEEARREAVRKALVDRALGLQTQLSEELAAERSFEEVLSPYQLEIETTEEFDLSAELEHEYADVLIPICLDTAEGELCRFVPVEEGILIAFVAQRKTIDIEMGLPAIRQELIAGLSQNRARQLAKDWQETLLNEAGFKNFMNGVE